MLFLTLAAACQVSDGGSPDGPPIDFTALRADVDEVFGGGWIAPITDLADCGDAGVEFTLALEVTGPARCTYGTRADPRDCSAARSALYGLEGTLAIGQDPPQAIDGGVGLWSQREGPSLHEVWLEPPLASFPHQTMDVIVDGYALADAVLVSVDWDRRLSEDSEEPVVWEQCTFSLGSPGG